MIVKIDLYLEIYFYYKLKDISYEISYIFEENLEKSTTSLNTNRGYEYERFIIGDTKN